MDVVADGVIVHRQQMETGVQRVRAELPEQAGQVEIWLPQLGDAAVRGLRFAGTATPAPLDRVQWATYGSSITQCGEAAGPADAWPAIVSRRLGWGLRGMGFGGECHLDQAALHELTSRPYDVVSMCLGINIFGAETFNGRSLPGQVATFAGAVARAQPDAAVVVITPIAASAAKEAERNGVGLTLDDIRMCVRLGVETANRTLEKPVHLIAGPDVLGHAETLQYLGDPVHPNPAGYRLMGERLAKILQEIAAC
ncbi:hypothetical protein JOF29_007234 [Kribbella aluminosa]|uniref:SGNH hydrolase-type esterase domain-containing protein n=1 Tax=Kribbella aluminosa TaxID=416017 RepID=A0ABS4UX76_9ACTN|nr:GDSL-type esterase/lipase family protein [Kribbella aluminosa]MBP2356124.1 hypothetical protein [Kribbella aluminosa]